MAQQPDAEAAGVGGVKITKELQEEVRKAANEAIKKLQEQSKKVKEDKHGYNTLFFATESANSGSTGTDGNDDEMSNENDGDDEKKSEKDKKGGDSNSSALSDLFKQFKETAKDIAEFAKKFLQLLKDAPISLETKKEIAGVCRQFKDLLEKTSFKLQAYRKEVAKMVIVFDTIVKVLVPPDDVKEGLSKLDVESKKKEIASFATENKEELKKRLIQLSGLLKDKTSVNDIKDLQGEWQTLNKAIEGVQAKVQRDLKAFRAKMGIIIGVTVAVIAVCGVVALVASGGTAYAAMAPVIGAVTAGGLLLGGGIVLFGAALLGILMAAMPEVSEALRVAQNESITLITNGLASIAEQATAMDQMLSCIYKAWLEIDDPMDAYSETWRSVQVETLIEKMKKTQKDLSKLENEIKETEAVCEDQLLSYGQNIYKPLMNLYK